MRSERLYLTDIVETAESIERVPRRRESRAVPPRRASPERRASEAALIGEAAARLPKPFRDQHPHVPWSQIAAFRNFAIHAYFSVDWPIVCVTATEEAPALREQVVRLLQASSDPG